MTAKKYKKLTLYLDGASRGNPGPAGIGVVILDENNATIKEFEKYLGVVTNNVAEYQALLYGLQEAMMLGAQEIALNLDSELVVQQLSGEFRVREPHMKLLFEQALHLLKGFKKFSIKHIDRSQNKQADKLANKAINLASLV